MKSKLKMILEKCRKQFDKDKRKNIIILSLFGAICLIGIIALIAANGKEEAVYRETQAVRGKLTVGITETGNVNIGTAEQTFDLDISEYTGSSSISQGGGMGGMEMFQNFSVTTSSTNSRALEIEEVCVTAGQEIEVGTPLLKLTDESVNSIRLQLNEDSENARIIYEQTQISKKQSDLQAQADLDANKAYGAYAESEYSKTVNELNALAEDVQEQLEDHNAQLEERTLELEEMKTLLGEQQTVLANAEYARDNTSREDSLYWWIVAVNTVSDTEELMEALKEEIETAEEEMETLTEEIADLSTQLTLAERDLKSGEITADIQKQLRQFNYENSEEIYDVAISQSSFDEAKAKEDYEEAKTKLDEFDSMIKESIISSEYAGVITDVAVSQGSTLEQDSSIITLNDYGEATITVSVDEKDMDSAQLGNAVNITFSAFPEQVFAGEVTEIGDAEINSNTNTTIYSVTVTVTDNVSGLYEGMSAEVTFITKESEEVIYISNRAITREDDTSFVRIKNNRGNIVKQEVVTGFSDGVNVEIVSGIEEGDAALIESGISNKN